MLRNSEKSHFFTYIFHPQIKEMEDDLLYYMWL